MFTTRLPPITPIHLHRWPRLSLMLALLLALAACFAPTPPPPSPTAALPTPTSGTAPWETLAPGLERRIYAPNDNNFSALVVLRLDPALYAFRAHYLPGQPLTTTQWQAALPGAVAFVNANFFDPQYNALGLVVADGIAYGQSYTDRGGLFQVQSGLPRVRSIILEPYAGESLDQAVQAFPMLMINGAAAYTDTRTDRASRRTVVAQDVYGRILLMATPLLGLSLVDLSAYLPTTDLQLVNALNLDGGGSTMMVVVPGPQPYVLAALDAVPTVLAVYPR